MRVSLEVTLSAVWTTRAWVFAALATAACSAPRVSVRSSLLVNDPPRIQSVVVAPLAGRSGDANAPVVVRLLLMQALTEAGVTVREFPPDKALAVEHSDRAALARLADDLGVDALLTGIVFAYGLGAAGAGHSPEPGVRLDARLIGRQHGDVLWIAQAEATGGPSSRPQSVTEVALALTRELARELRDELH